MWDGGSTKFRNHFTEHDHMRLHALFKKTKPNFNIKQVQNLLENSLNGNPNKEQKLGIRCSNIF